MKRTPVIIALCVIAAALAYGLFVNAQASKVKTQIATFSATIPLGASRDWVNRECHRAAAATSRWRYHPSCGEFASSVACLQSPVTFGAGNWVVYILFDNGNVDAVLVRTMDTKTDHPPDAPPDRVSHPHNPLLPEFGGIQ